jgi:hypothetical protein
MEVLDADTAENWLHVGFGRGRCSLQDKRLCAAESLSSRLTVSRLQVVIAQSLQSQMSEQMRKVLAETDPKSSVIVLKRLWDETAMRLQVSVDRLREVLGDGMAEHAIALKKSGRGANGCMYPGFTVQTLQQSGFLRWGRDKEQGCEIIYPARVTSTTSADSIWNAMGGACSPCLSPE